ncbi:hypothetical protein PGUG_02888 [Meyerozyma guilliermondii ATCC 6260]|uniref:Zn(2)-C6 fungal-type domain-containing protein n=1 Tax=Meyerozyma guilliermondii (strain ATCC 6260 / CBS 566 / DSM 6381 / JCM 1539 / NBRC 10279 / NRRL Y-324) TaxID=294746 RepID=A5DHY7_PICGU|nr:uncharacterized protein PGUG_02888 [Meyerozyma guilliermondii ATCC 6260]EDK38790.2 hypothetical protein PGUG_02888 [Meyerozyma guilliermondii ATCC 6260]
MDATPLNGSPDPLSDFASRWRQVRACARCHRLKMKCIYDNPSHSACRRCFSSGIACSLDNDPTAKQAKKKRKLPKKSEPTLLQQLRQIEESVYEQEPDEIEGYEARKIIDSILTRINGKVSTRSPRNSTNTPQMRSISPKFAENSYEISTDDNLARELIANNIITKEVLRARFSFFLEHMLPYCPLVSFSSNQSDFEFQLENTPLLLVSCVFATTINNNTSAMKLAGNSETNRELQNTLLHYLDLYLANRIFFEAKNFSLSLVTACLVLSLWCIVPNNGNHKNQIKLLLAYNVSLCMGLGDSSKHTNTQLEEENGGLRTFLAVYCCCSSLGLSLPRFKLPTWSKDHEYAYNVLAQNRTSSMTDSCLCSISKLVKSGHEALEILNPERAKISGSNTMLIIDAYVHQLVAILKENNINVDGHLKIVHKENREEFLVSFIYYQILMNIYDNFITTNMTNSPINEELSLLVFGSIIKLTTVCENLLECFVELSNGSINYPTFFFYKPFHALVILIRLKLILKSGFLKLNCNLTTSSDDSTVQSYVNQIDEIMKENESKWDSNISVNMSSVLAKVKKWMIVCSKFKGRSEHSASDPSAQHLLSLILNSKNKEIESLEPPQEQSHHHQIEPVMEASFENTIEEIFKEMDSDLSRALNPFESLMATSDYPFESPFV